MAGDSARMVLQRSGCNRIRGARRCGRWRALV